MRKIKQTHRPYIIAYSKGDRRLHDCAKTLDAAKTRIAERATRIKGETAAVFLNGTMVYPSAQTN